MLNNLGENIDNIIMAFSHPFFMVLFGLAFWFTLMWSMDMEHRKKLSKTFWQDQKDEVIVALMGGLLFLIWDDEILEAYNDWTGRHGDTEFKSYYYLMVAPAIDRLYWVIKKVRHKDKM